MIYQTHPVYSPRPSRPHHLYKHKHYPPKNPMQNPAYRINPEEEKRRENNNNKSINEDVGCRQRNPSFIVPAKFASSIPCSFSISPPISSVQCWSSSKIPHIPFYVKTTPSSLFDTSFWRKTSMAAPFIHKPNPFVRKRSREQTNTYTHIVHAHTRIHTGLTGLTARLPPPPPGPA